MRKERTGRSSVQLTRVAFQFASKLLEIEALVERTPALTRSKDGPIPSNRSVHRSPIPVVEGIGTVSQLKTFVRRHVKDC